MGIFAAYFQNIFYYEHLWTAASETSSKSKMELSLKYHEIWIAKKFYVGNFRRWQSSLSSFRQKFLITD